MHPIISACKLVAVSIAWTLQRIISAFHSAVRGGQIAGDALVVMLKNAGMLKHGPHDSFADEVVGYLLAFFGLATQIKHGFNLPFPANLLLVPVSFVEVGLRWCVHAHLRTLFFVHLTRESAATRGGLYPPFT